METTAAVVAVLPSPVSKDPKVPKDAGAKRRKKRTGSSFKSNLHKVLKDVRGSVRISKRSLHAVDSIVESVLHRIASQAVVVNKHSAKKTLSAKDIEAACFLSISGSLGYDAIAAGRKAVGSFIQTTTPKD